MAYAQGAPRSREARPPLYQAVVALEAWLRTPGVDDGHASLPDRPDALARWAAFGQGGLLPDVRRLPGRALGGSPGVPARVAEGFAPGDLC